MSLTPNGGSPAPKAQSCNTCNGKAKKADANAAGTPTDADQDMNVDHMFGGDTDGTGGESMQMAANGQPGDTTYGYGPYWGQPATPENVAAMNAARLSNLGAGTGGVGMNMGGTITPGGMGTMKIR